MSAEKYLQILQQEIHSVIFATTDSMNLPVTGNLDTDQRELHIISRSVQKSFGNKGGTPP